MDPIEGNEANPLRAAALACVQAGWPVLPVHTMFDGHCSCGEDDCDSPGKHPLLPNGLNGASSDAADIDVWWSKCPEANVGLRTGPESRLWVLDADGEAGVAALRELESRYGGLPATPRVRTGG